MEGRVAFFIKLRESTDVPSSNNHFCSCNRLKLITSEGLYGFRPMKATNYIIRGGAEKIEKEVFAIVILFTC